MPNRSNLSAYQGGVRSNVLDTVGVGWLAPMPDMRRGLAADPAASWRLQLSGPDADQAAPTRAVFNASRMQLTWHAKPPEGHAADEGVGYLVARASLPKLLYGSNHVELRPQDVELGFHQLVTQACTAAGLPAPPPEDVLLNRIDLTRNRPMGSDQAVAEELRRLASAGRLLVPGRWKFTFHRDRQLHGALTVLWRQQDRSLMVYDKHRESREEAAAGLCRYEIRHQGRGVQRHLHLRLLTDIAAARLEELLQGYLDQVPAFAAGESLADRIMAGCVQLYGERRGRTTALRLMGYMAGAQAGEWDALPASSQRRYRHDIRVLATMLGTVGQQSPAGMEEGEGDVLDSYDSTLAEYLAGAVVARREVAAAADRDSDTTEGDDS